MLKTNNNNDDDGNVDGGLKQSDQKNNTSVSVLVGPEKISDQDRWQKIFFCNLSI